MNAHIAKILENILEDPDTIEADGYGHKWATMPRRRIKTKVCIRCGIAKHNLRAKKPCLVAI